MKIKCTYCNQEGSNAYCGHCGHALPELEEVAQCLDDCLVLLMPEEFTVTKWLEVGERIKAKGGRLAYISSNIDALQER